MGMNENAVLTTLDGTVMPLVGVKAHGTLAGAMFEMSVEQRYHNDRRTNIEAIYTFPLAHGAVLLGIELELNGKTLSGIAVEKKQAEKRYEEAIEDGDSAILLEKSGDGLYTVNLGNLMAGEEAVVRFRYGQLLTWEQGRLRLTIPSTIAPRYGNPQTQGMQPHQVPVEDVVVEYPFSLDIDVLGDLATHQIDSPTHCLKTQLIDKGLRITLGQATLDRDVVLTVAGCADSMVHVARDADNWVALAAFCPTIDGVATDAPISLRVVIDCSGSMGGVSIQSARRGALRVIESLNPSDEFAITRFGSGHVHLFDRLEPADSRHISLATQFLHGTEADMGGTAMAEALDAASSLTGQREGGVVLLISDGEIWGVDLLIQTARQSGLRYFVVGVGMSPSHPTLARLASETGGGYEAVTPGEDIEAAIVRQFGRMRQPRANRLRLVYPQNTTWTTDLPSALFKGDTVHAFAELAAEPAGSVRLLYTLNDGTTLEERATVQIWPSDPETLARLAAATRLRQNKDGEEAKGFLTRLAIRYNLVSDFTHYIVVHKRAENEKADGLPEVVKVRQMMAAGWGGSQKAMQALRSLRLEASSLQSFASAGFDSDDDIPTSIHSNVCLTAHDNPWTMYKRTFQKEPNFFENLDQRLNARFRGGVQTRLAVLNKLGLPARVLRELVSLVDGGIEEELVVLSFFKAMLDLGKLDQISEKGRAKIVKALQEGHQHDDALISRLMRICKLYC